MRNIRSHVLQRHIIEHSKFIVKTTAWNGKQKWLLQYLINYFLGLTLSPPGTLLVRSTILLFLLCIFSARSLSQTTVRSDLKCINPK